MQFNGDLKSDSEQLRYMIVFPLVMLKGKVESSWRPWEETSAVTQVLLLLRKFGGRILNRWMVGEMEIIG